MRTRFALVVVTTMVAVAMLALSGVAWAAVAPLAVTKTAPSGGAKGVARTANVNAYFNHDMRASTVTSATFKIRKQGTTTWLGATRSVNNAVSPTSTNGGSQSVVRLNPNADLAPGTTYEVMIVGGRSGVKAVNGKALGTNKMWTFTTVATPPNTTIDSGPAGTVASGSASFSFSSSKAGSTFQCKLDAGAYGACTPPKDYADLSAGQHTFSVRATDAAGNTDPTPASRSWTVDTVAPAAPSAHLKANTNSGSENDNITNHIYPTIGGTAEGAWCVKIYDAQNNGINCALVGHDGAWSHTLGPLTPDGTYSFTVKATDAVGNESQGTPIDLIIDTTPPETTLVDKPASLTNSSSATFTFSSNESSATFGCNLDNVGFNCASPQHVPSGGGSLANGSHTLMVGAMDAAGNFETTPVSYTWTVDTIAPKINSVSPANAATFVAPSTDVTATFSESMDSSSISDQTFTLTPQGSTSPVAAAVSYDESTKKVTLNPSSDLAPNTTYIATVKGPSSGVKDRAGNTLAQDHSWTFTTRAAVVVTPSPLDFTPGTSACNTTITKTATITNNSAGQVNLYPSVTGFGYSVSSDVLTIASGESRDLSVSWTSPSSGGGKGSSVGRLYLKDADGNTKGTGDLQAFYSCGFFDGVTL